MILTNKQLVGECLKMAGYDTPVDRQSCGITYYKGRWGYVLGSQGELYTRELARKWADSRRSGKPASYFLNDAIEWYTPPTRIVDCSGMIVQAIRVYKPDYYDRSANTFKAQFVKSGDIKSIPNMPGSAVWKDGHIGIYIGNGKVVESRGVHYGVVVSNLTTQRWTRWGYLRDVEYIEEPVSNPVFVLSRELRYIPGKMMKGDDVKTVQNLLISKGFSCGSCGADGIFGEKTKSAVVAFQHVKGLKEDGIIGTKTISALGGIFKEGK